MSPQAAPTLCPLPGCQQMQPCPEHAGPTARSPLGQGASALRLGGGSTWRWREIRAAQLRREPLCRECKAGGRVQVASHADHILPRTEGGTDDLANLQSLCAEHHRAKTGDEIRRVKLQHTL